LVCPKRGEFLMHYKMHYFLYKYLSRKSGAHLYII